MKNVFFFLLLTLGPAQAQSTLTVRGHVVDANSGQSLNGASLTVLEPADVGTSTNEKGWFGLVLSVGSYTLQVSYVGYATQRIALNLIRDEVINVRLKATGNQLTEVVVTGQSNQDKVMSTQTSVEMVDRKTALVLPVVFGS